METTNAAYEKDGLKWERVSAVPEGSQSAVRLPWELLSVGVQFVRGMKGEVWRVSYILEVGGKVLE